MSSLLFVIALDPGHDTTKTCDTVRNDSKNPPFLCNLILSLHFLLLKLSDVPHSDLLAEFNKHLILHLKKKKHLHEYYCNTSILQSGF